MAGSGRQNADDALAVALASGATIRDAAEAAGVSERTAHRRWSDAEFRGRVRGLRGMVVERAVAALADAMTEAAGVLRALLKAEAESVRLGAARLILSLGVELRAAVELEERLRELEKQVHPEKEGEAWD